MEPAALNGMFVYLDIVADFTCQQCGVCCNNDWLVTVDEAGYQRNRQLFAQLGRQDEFARSWASTPGLPSGRPAVAGFLR